jgi:hypothetical protein
MNLLPDEIIRHIFSFRAEFRQSLRVCAACRAVCLYTANRRMYCIRDFYVLSSRVTCAECKGLLTTRQPHAEATTSSWGKEGLAEGLDLSAICR